MGRHAVSQQPSGTHTATAAQPPKPAGNNSRAHADNGIITRCHPATWPCDAAAAVHVIRMHGKADHRQADPWHWQAQVVLQPHVATPAWPEDHAQAAHAQALPAPTAAQRNATAAPRTRNSGVSGRPARCPAMSVQGNARPSQMPQLVGVGLGRAATKPWRAQHAQRGRRVPDAS